MKIVLAAVGRLKDGPERALADRYMERASQAGRALALGPITTVELPESRGSQSEQRKREEADALSARLPSCYIALDERGQMLDSPAFAEALRNFRDRGEAALGLVIGGPDGLAVSLRDGAALTISFGRLTWPHQIVRILAAEQLYRATTILSGHPYHRV
ncbi:ribosomal RNA large subunit methyltransferase H [Agaricicola taiwanensis]|uniref:Ribosomal RNA large subunit methyltransferase H n=1 Tax=Agaricicola taiwanensis TaxID=591372 RepID=A0A8J2YB69_9RHOB|nr:23S rRNA (pseudouridine(1915)-N(3))-methyltransferase RlmH [Agaricicola taiwanensis]GGE26952.1 ribosomal RNA large subunit methyltransferase H [Agaricicola taiwanensis]